MQPLLTVCLTGSTGNFGAYLLDKLLSNDRISDIYCLNRSSDAASRQARSHKDRGLSSDFPATIHFLKVDLSATGLGLEREQYEVLVRNVDLIIHNAWPVDFNRRLPSFQSSLDGVDNLISFARAASALSPPRATPHLLFTSSIGAVSNWATYAATSRDRIPEAELIEWKLARTGYGQSKLVAERLLARAAVAFDIPVSVVRIAQLAGPVQHGVHGAWPPQEWVPSIIGSAVGLGLIPRDLGPNEVVDWMPVDLAAQVLVELALAAFDQNGLGVSQGLFEKIGGGKEKKTRKRAKTNPAQFYHLSNPSLTPWSALLPAIIKHLPGDVHVVDIVEWVDALGQVVLRKEAGVSTEEQESLIPAAKLWDNFEFIRDRAVRFPGSSVVTLETTRSVKQSPTLATMKAVSGEWMELWMKQWGFSP